jgi:hypothetical protein
MRGCRSWLPNDLEIEVMKEVAAKNCERSGSPTASCVWLGASSLGAASYQGRKTARDKPLVERMRELSAQCPRYGYRRIRIFLGRDGYRMSPGRMHRLWPGGGPARAAQAAEEEGCRGSAATASAVRPEPGLVL